MNARNTKIAAAAVLVAAVTAWILWPRHESPAVRASAPPSAAAGNHRGSVSAAALTDSRIVSKRSPRHGEIQRMAQAPASFAPMPPVDAPMRLVYRQLKEQADAGDPVAQCRLAHELLRCRRLPEEMQTSKDIEARFGKRPDGARMVRMVHDQLATDTAVCQDFTPDPGDEPWRLMLRAALDGNHAAALQFAVGPPLDRTKPVADLDGWEAYREYAPVLLQQAIADGDSRAYQIAASFGRFDLYGVALVPNDPIQTAAYDLALMPIAAPSYRAFLQKEMQSLHLGDADLAQAQARAASLSSRLKPPPDGAPVVGNNIIGYGRWNDGAECEH